MYIDAREMRFAIVNYRAIVKIYRVGDWGRSIGCGKSQRDVAAQRVSQVHSGVGAPRPFNGI